MASAFRIGRLRESFVVLRTQPAGRRRNCGPFDNLPVELLHYFFDFLPLADVGQLALVSEAFRSKVTQWIWTARCLDRATKEFSKVYEPDFDVTDEIELSSRSDLLSIYVDTLPVLDDFGVMCKRVTCLSHTTDRINFAFTAFEHCLRRHCDQLERRLDDEGKKSVDWLRAMHLFQFMKLMHTFTKGWESIEFCGILEQLEKSFRISNDLLEIFDSTDLLSVALDTEIKLRFIMRTLTWDVTGEDYAERAAWILAAIKYWIGTHTNPKAQARLFLLMFGYGCDDSSYHFQAASKLTFQKRAILYDLHNHTDWECFIELVPEDFHDGKRMFLPLAQAVCSCMLQDESWKNEMLTPILDEMFKTPGRWMRENIASFLLFCSESLILHYIGDMINDEEDDQLEKGAKMVIDMIIMSHRFQNELTGEKGIGKVFNKLCVIGKSTSVRQRFHTYIWRTIHNLIKENSDDFNEAGMDILLNFGKHIMTTAYSSPAPAGKKPVIIHEEMDIEE